MFGVSKVLSTNVTTKSCFLRSKIREVELKRSVRAARRVVKHGKELDGASSESHHVYRVPKWCMSQFRLGPSDSGLGAFVALQSIDPCFALQLCT